MTDVNAEEKLAAAQAALSAEAEPIPAEKNTAEEEIPAAEEAPAVPEFVELGNLIPEIRGLLGPEEQVVEKPKEEKKKPGRAKKFWRAFGCFLATTVLRLLLVIVTAVLIVFAGVLCSPAPRLMPGIS